VIFIEHNLVLIHYGRRTKLCEKAVSNKDEFIGIDDAYPFTNDGAKTKIPEVSIETSGIGIAP